MDWHDKQVQVQIERLALKKIQIGLRQMVSPAFFEGVSLDLSVDALTENLVMSLRAFLWGRDVQRRTDESVQVPVSWWDGLLQVLKARLPRRLARRLRPRMRTIATQVTETRVCPHLNHATYGQEAHFAWLRDMPPWEHWR